MDKVEENINTRVEYNNKYSDRLNEIFEKEIRLYKEKMNAYGIPDLQNHRYKAVHRGHTRISQDSLPTV